MFLTRIAFLLSFQFNAIKDYDDDHDYISANETRILLSRLTRHYSTSFRFPVQSVWSSRTWNCRGGDFISSSKKLQLSNLLQIAALVSGEFGVEFRMMEKVEVKGSNVHPVWRYLTGEVLGRQEI